MYVLTCVQMKEAERLSVEGGLSYQGLMENAGISVFHSIYHREGDLLGKKAVVLCGSGNNGGDGFVVSRLLNEAGVDVQTVLVDGVPRSDEATSMYEIIYAKGQTIFWIDEDPAELNRCLLETDIIVDAIYGTGFHGALPDKLNLLVQMSNMSNANVYSVDIPSGMEGDSGIVRGRCFEATVTVALGALKPAHIFEHETRFLGQVELGDIGIYLEYYTQLGAATFLVDSDMAYAPLTKRPLNANKGMFGRLFMLCGSHGMVGAATLVARAAYRSGAGLVCAALPESEFPAFYSHLVEAVTVPLPENGEGLRLTHSMIAEELDRSTAGVIGSGLGLSADAEEWVSECITKSRHPLVIDGDALTIVSKNLRLLENRAADLVLTPHPGEMGRLIGQSAAYVNDHRADVAKVFAQNYNITLVLKGAKTIIADPLGNVYINPTGNPGLSKAGSGDLLAGTIGGLLAQGYTPLQSAVSGTYLHGLAADYTADRLSQYSMMASDVLDDYARVFKPCDSER